MPSNYTAAWACGHSVDVLSEEEENTEAQAYSQGEETGPSEYETDSDGSQDKVAPAKASHTGIRDLDDDSFRAQLDLEFKEYRAAKKRFLLSLIHDNAPVKCENDWFQVADWLFGDEIIVLKDLNDDGHLRGGKEKKRRERRVKPRSRTSSRENALEEPGNVETHKENDVPSVSTVSVQQVRDAEPPLSVVDSVQDEEPLCEDNDAPVEDFHYDETLSAEQESERERRVGMRRLYRWERFRFRSLTSDGHSQDVASAPSIIANQLEAVENYTAKLQQKREKIGDSLFKDEGSKHKNLCYIDSRDADLFRPMPLISASNYFQVLPEKLPQKQDKSTLSVSKAMGKPSVSEKQADVSKEQAAATVKSEPAPAETKKDKKNKKKKRKSSSSSEDLEELERKSEARLGKRK